ncbi:hypothetical protein CTAM01_02938 [Colletotrichum tamarilloi]|uniref:Uncharacterized protein n=1 Tax=Colletotrichum tamarilloi TaxID=1209934 RepID=A0ABQ9RKN9_9PEZI|nr:uncharacterized protein CTAM01_02938 [Colletotrichum tamarilloi]KAK1506606.1 hypothetical protein CTAM01_02938 [Colletotrichum tamarilloi]
MALFSSTVPFSWVWDKTRSKQADSDEARQIRYNYNVFLAAKGCRECEGIDFQDTTTLHHKGAASRWIPLPPTIALYALPRIFDWLRKVMITWELPLFRIVKNEAITVDFITQKLKEFQTKYGNAFSLTWADTESPLNYSGLSDPVTAAD